MDIRASIAAQGYAAVKPATASNPTEGGGKLQSAAQEFAQTLQNAEQTALGAMSGGADPHSLVQALAQSELAVETAVTMRDKVVEAYQEILRMPV